MPVQQASFYCPVCQQQRLFTSQGGVNQVFYLLLTLFSCGLWAIVWFIQNISYTPRYHCSQCGFSDAAKYLANPNLRPQEAQLKAERAAMRGGTSPPFSNSFTDWFSGLSTGQKVFMVGLVFFGVVLLGGFLSALQSVDREANTQANAVNTSNASNKPSASATPIVYPAGLSPAVNLEKGRMALSQGDNKTAWAHLFQIPRNAREYSSAKQLLARIPEREQIEFELVNLNEREKNLESMATGLAYEVEPSELKNRLDNIEKQQREIFARRRDLNRKLDKMP
jgi:predicted RNA-binding Zn-ribbon protein involved in translation (DUF1610 family)